jgi:hypothetical protein
VVDQDTRQQLGHVAADGQGRVPRLRKGFARLDIVYLLLLCTWFLLSPVGIASSLGA